MSLDTTLNAQHSASTEAALEKRSHCYTRLHKPTERRQPPEGSARGTAFRLVESSRWVWTVNGVIIFNIVINMCEYDGQPASLGATLDTLNFLCLVFFTAELAVKLVAYFPAMYWQDNWNKFDAVVVLLSWAAIAFQLRSVQAIRALRALRIILVLKSAKGIRMIFETIILSFYPSINISVLLLLLYSLFAIGGMQMFGHMPLQDIECRWRERAHCSLSVHELLHETV